MTRHRSLSGEVSAAQSAPGPARERVLAVLGASAALTDHLVAHPDQWRAAVDARDLDAGERTAALVRAVEEALRARAAAVGGVGSEGRDRRAGQGGGVVEGELRALRQSGGSCLGPQPVAEGRDRGVEAVLVAEQQVGLLGVLAIA